MKNNMGITGYDMRIRKNIMGNFWEVLEEIKGKILSILHHEGSGLMHIYRLCIHL